MSTEQMSGTAPYRVTLHQGRVVLVEIWRDGARMTFGSKTFDGTCARCGREMRVFTPDNDTMEVCNRCDQILAASNE